MRVPSSSSRGDGRSPAGTCHGQYDAFTLLLSADAVVVISVMLGGTLTGVAAFSSAGLGRKRLPFWRRGTVERGATGNYGVADWTPTTEARRRLPERGGIVVDEAYRVDQDAGARGPFDPKSRRSWSKGGKAPLPEYHCDTSSTHGLVFASAGGFKSTSIAAPTLIR